MTIRNNLVPLDRYVDLRQQLLTYLDTDQVREHMPSNMQADLDQLLHDTAYFCAVCGWTPDGTRTRCLCPWTPPVGFYV